MNYKNYQKSRNATWQMLIDLGIKELPIKTTDLCRRIGVSVKVAELDPDIDGYTTTINEIPTIIVNSLKLENHARLRFTVAHEIGHILLGHVGIYDLVHRNPFDEQTEHEREANVFASRLLAPACVLWGCGVQSPEQIIQLCDISYQAAQFRWERMKVLYERNKFLTSPLEKQVYEKFKPFVLKWLLGKKEGF